MNDAIVTLGNFGDHVFSPSGALAPSLGTREPNAILTCVLKLELARVSCGRGRIVAIDIIRSYRNRVGDRFVRVTTIPMKGSSHD